MLYVHSKYFILKIIRVYVLQFNNGKYQDASQLSRNEMFVC